MNLSSPISYPSSPQHTHPPDTWKEEDDKISEALAGTEIKTQQTQLKCAFIPPSFLLYDVSEDHLCPAKGRRGAEKKTTLSKVHGKRMKESSPTPRFYCESLC